MIEIRFHGRGGQGSVTAAEILAKAVFEEGKYTQAFPSFGVERRGAPVTAFARISDEPIRRRYQIYNPQYVVVLDETLANVVNLTSGIQKDNGAVLVNTKRDAIDSITDVDVHTVDATGIVSFKDSERVVYLIESSTFLASSKLIRVGGRLTTQVNISLLK